MSFKDRLNKLKTDISQKTQRKKYETKSDTGTDETTDDVSREPVSLVNHISKLKKSISETKQHIKDKQTDVLENKQTLSKETYQLKKNEQLLKKTYKDIERCDKDIQSFKQKKEAAKNNFDKENYEISEQHERDNLRKLKKSKIELELTNKQLTESLEIKKKDNVEILLSIKEYEKYIKDTTKRLNDILKQSSNETRNALSHYKNETANMTKRFNTYQKQIDPKKLLNKEDIANYSYFDHENGTLYTLFEFVRRLVNFGLQHHVLPKGVSQTVIVNSSLEINVSLDHRMPFFKQSVNIRFRNRKNNTDSCINIAVHPSDPKAFIIDKIYTQNCSFDNNPMFTRHCLMYLTLLFCTFMRPHTIYLYDCNCQTKNSGKYRSAQYYRSMETYKQPEDRKKFLNTEDSQTYSYHYSYFAPYGFKDEPAKTDKYLECFDNSCLEDNHESNPDNTEPKMFYHINADTNRKEGFFTMVFHHSDMDSAEFDKVFKEAMENITLHDMKALCQSLPCNEKMFKNQCSGNQFKWIIENMQDTTRETEDKDSNTETDTDKGSDTDTKKDTDTDDSDENNGRFGLFPYYPVSYHFV